MDPVLGKADIECPLSTYFNANSRSYCRKVVMVEEEGPPTKYRKLSDSSRTPVESTQEADSQSQHLSQSKNGSNTVFRKPFSHIHKIATMYFDEPQHQLYLGFNDGEVECFVPNFIPDPPSEDTPSLPRTPMTIEQELIEFNEEIDAAIESKIRREEMESLFASDGDQ